MLIGVTICISGIIALFVISALGWFDFEYRAYAHAYRVYKYRVTPCKITYEEFKQKIAARKELGFAFTAQERNDRREQLFALNNILEQKPDLVRQYFSVKKFSYLKQHKTMRSEASRCGATLTLSRKHPQTQTEQLPTFRNLITISDATKKEQVLSKIQIYLLANKKGRSIALLIAALYQLDYLAITTPIAPLLRYMAAHYKEKLGVPQGVTTYINKDKSHKFKANEISSTIQFLNK